MNDDHREGAAGATLGFVTRSIPTASTPNVGTPEDVHHLHALLSRRFPDLRIDFDPAETATGPWFIFIHRKVGDLLIAPVSIEWNPKYGFGLSTPEWYDYGTGVDEAFPDAQATYDRAVYLVLTCGPSVPPPIVQRAGSRSSTGPVGDDGP